MVQSQIHRYLIISATIISNFMFNGLHSMPPAAAELATQALADERKYKFPSFSASDAVALVSLNSGGVP